MRYPRTTVWKGLAVFLLLFGVVGCDTIEDVFGNEKEAQGLVEEIGDNFLVVGGIRYQVTADTEFEGIDGLAGLSVGDEVEVEYEENGDTRTAVEVELAGSDDDGGLFGKAAGKQLDVGLCAGDPGSFTLEIDNPYFPLPVGQTWVLEGEEDDELVRVEIEVLDETEVVGGVTTRVVIEREWADDEQAEISWNWFAQAADGTVCYFGEHVDNYEDGEVDNNDGSWRADDPGNYPGIIMPAHAKPGLMHQQEGAPGIAEDEAKIIGSGSVEVEAGLFEDVIRVREANPLEGDKDYKNYAHGVGIIVDGPIELVELIVPGP